jgi:predicted nucleic acid-binding Zn ribbon protein
MKWDKRAERGKPRRPEPLGDVLKTYLDEAGLSKRVEQAAIIPEWPTLVGSAIAAETEPLYVTADGTLFVAVRTNAWMTELQLMAPQLLRALNQSHQPSQQTDKAPGTRHSPAHSTAPGAPPTRARIVRLRFVLQRS